MKKNVLGLVTALNTAALIGIVGVSVHTDDEPLQERVTQVAPPAASTPDLVEALEKRVAALEERLE